MEIVMKCFVPVNFQKSAIHITVCSWQAAPWLHVLVKNAMQVQNLFKEDL
jgi:hypothetical protein